MTINRNKILRLARRNGGLVANKLEVLSDGGSFVVQELPVRSINMHFEANGVGVVTLELHADLLTMTDGD